MIKISPENPPHNIRELCEVTFDIDCKDIVFTFEDTIYNVHTDLDHGVIAHEATHTKQQSDAPVEWWDIYLHDADFRFSQELEAYRAQYKVYQKQTKDREVLFKHLYRLATDLSGPIYGFVCTRQEAMRLIKQ